ncbi:PD-(D/E)XK nuclease family protein [Chloroflexota bacterium]
MENNFKLSPSDLTFLWDECPRCFYLKVARNFRRPSMPFPSIFGRIDGLMKLHYEGKPTGELSAELPEGVVSFAEKWVTSQPITLPGHSSQCFLRGKFDTVVTFTDGSYGVIDFKTSKPKPYHIPFYSRQLHAYMYALENPAPGKFALSPISILGLLVVEPVGMSDTPGGQLAYLGDVTWLECPRDDEGFMEFLDQVLALLERQTPPDANPKCGWCSYRQAARNTYY